MKQFIRKLFLYGILVVLIIWVVPFFTGQLVEKKYDELLAVLSEFESITVEPLEYNRGWLTSTATSRLTLETPGIRLLYEKFVGKESFKPIVVLLRHNIAHGPIIRPGVGDRRWHFALANIQTELDVASILKKIATEQLGATKLLNIETKMAIDGKVEIVLQGSPLSLQKTITEPPVTWKGITGKWTLTQDLTELNGELIVPGFDLTIYDTDIVADDIILKTHRTKTSEGLWLNQGTFNFNKFKLVEQNGKNLINVVDVNVDASVQQNGKLIDLFGSMQARTFEIMDFIGGSLEYSTSLHNVDPSVFVLLKNVDSALTKKQTFIDEWSIVQKMIEAIPVFLVNRPEFIINKMNITTPEGLITGKIKIAMGGPNAHDLTNTEAIILSMNAEGYVQIPRVLLRRALTERLRRGFLHKNLAMEEKPERLAEEITQIVNQELTQWEEMGLLVIQGKNYLITLQFQNGKLFINDKDFSTEDAWQGVTQSSNIAALSAKTMSREG